MKPKTNIQKVIYMKVKDENKSDSTAVKRPSSILTRANKEQKGL